MNTIQDILLSSSPRDALAEQLVLPNRFLFVEALRLQALRSYKEAVDGSPNADLRTILTDAETQALQRQFERLDGVIVGTLNKDGARSLYDNYSPDVDRDLPANPNDLRDPRVAYRYALQRLYRRQFDVTMVHERKDGCWPLVCFDLLSALDARRILIVDSVPEAVADHASLSYMSQLDLPSLDRVHQTFDVVRKDAIRRLAELGEGPREHFATANVVRVAKILWKVVEWCVTAEGAWSIAKQAREAWEERKRAKEAEEKARLEKEAQAREREYQEKIQRELRERSIPDGSGHMDLYEKNKGYIGGVC
ncbi:MAG: hypothetical protein PS018_03690 [bacterium]|nr:hypothetical protein [bacterium]